MSSSYKIILVELSKDDEITINTQRSMSVSKETLDLVLNFIQECKNKENKERDLKVETEEDLQSQLYKNTDTQRDATIAEKEIKRRTHYQFPIDTIRNLIEEGKGDAEIARLLQIPYQTMHGFIKKKNLRNMTTLEYLKAKGDA